MAVAPRRLGLKMLPVRGLSTDSEQAPPYIRSLQNGLMQDTCPSLLPNRGVVPGQVVAHPFLPYPVGTGVVLPPPPPPPRGNRVANLGPVHPDVQGTGQFTPAHGFWQPAGQFHPLPEQSSGTAFRFNNGPEPFIQPPQQVRSSLAAPDSSNVSKFSWLPSVLSCN